ncbi:insulin-like growth factor-binding protein complex acid labile subunit [Lytechinus pictus]|uniref:insulin-like growth factor-binding protein complex acid labile subunit n=1 Tax=Lytechinus pictus TaxID=7653 RepID=UPI0030BA228D
MSKMRIMFNHLCLLFGLVSYLATTPAAATTCGQLCHYVPWARDADCSSRHLRRIPEECVGSKALNLNRNNISEVPSRVFSPFHHLKYLQILGSQVTTVQANSFGGAKRLKSINLMFNVITVLPEHSLNDTDSLRWVYLTGNRIETIESGVFQEVPQIEMLYLDDNQLDHLDEGVFHGLSKLQRLLLAGNRLQEISGSTFRGVAGLKYIDLSRNQLRVLSRDTFQGLRNLKTINVASNGLTSISAGTFSFSELTSLNISSNDLTTLPLEQHELASLDEIDAKGNPWNCDCSLDHFRETLISISNKGVTCKQPSSRADTHIVSYTSLCIASTPLIPDITEKPKKFFQSGQDTDKEGPEVEQVAPSGGFPPEIITLIVVLTIASIALFAIGLFLAVFVFRPVLQRRRNKKREKTKDEKPKPQHV